MSLRTTNLSPMTTHLDGRRYRNAPALMRHCATTPILLPTNSAPSISRDCGLFPHQSDLHQMGIAPWKGGDFRRHWPGQDAHGDCLAIPLWRIPGFR